jgi:hypothetical protein
MRSLFMDDIIGLKILSRPEKGLPSPGRRSCQIPG